MTNLEPIYVLDTHTLFWYLTTDKKLSKRANELFEAAENGQTQFAVSVIVLAELYHLNLKQKSPLDFAVIYKELAENPAYLLIPFHRTILATKCL